MKKKNTETKKPADWSDDPHFKAMLAKLQEQQDKETSRQEDLSRFAAKLDNADPVQNAYALIHYYYEQHNRYYGDYEFLILLASRGFDVSVYQMSVFKDWKVAAADEIEKQSWSSHYNANTGEQKVVKTNLEEIWPFPEFWRSGRNEANSIDATMLRMVDHFKINGFDGYWNEMKQDVELSVAGNSEGQHAMAQYLFNMCRSETGIGLLQERMAIIIEIMIKGKPHNIKHFWEYQDLNKDGRYHYKCPYIAAGLLFSILKLGLREKYGDVVGACEKYLLSAQSANGGWKAVSLHETESVDATAVCTHALALMDRAKNQQSLTLAGEYLLSKQDSWWLWHEDINPYVSYPYLSVLVLDALELARGNDSKLTFKLAPLQQGIQNSENIKKIIINQMGDNYNFNGGQFGAVGHEAKAENNTFNQANYQLPANLNYEQLAAELDQLKTAMKGKADTPEEYLALAEVANARQAASEQDGNKVVQKLLGAGKWALDTAKDIGVGVVVELLNKHISG
ncbi:hypothetical protein J3L21_04085 [Mucilaginibacter rubeus]|uniref:Squalene cyclase C-terminal domain-containing protein n=1 Tax=Mucilaginibacter rubeus TaxID=2027860 RepID=A0ABX7UEY7_9SPHI|nr:MULTISPECIES: hypothetical protein [Mucilaginibacter]QEM18897.1 hypothetical protein DIU38_023605 [Mucilaginibacter gossypii]QTE44560.1 hypothetical protein J3L19_04110 [Mucilaginibacter rubeus]QTE51158.1 hypothetical protein J3L21_04085 [Mucilaginibacter rubeus]QTE56244.1 hypothetical protein J3L23_29335 [Mucilaginibacter rubeus]QTF63054.1 hypothetical protein J3L20_04180 [Mucilaginibacter rubeus]